MKTIVCRAAILICALAGSMAAQDTRKALSKPFPRYPEIAKRMNLVGAVKVEIVVGADGKIKETNVVGGHPVLVDATLMALKEWKYEAAKSETSITLTFDFRPNSNN
jgi:TonB family protein